jgi:Tfp pilus assembly protein PilF
MLGHLRAVPLLYFRPVRAINALLDHGSGGAALLLAAAVMLLFWMQGATPVFGVQPAPVAHSAAVQEDSEEEGPAPATAILDRAIAAGLRFLIPSGPAVLAILILVFIPSAIMVVARIDSLGGSGTILRRDYMAVLAVVGSAWAAAYLPAAILHWIFLGSPPLGMASSLLAQLYFLFLTVMALRIILSTSAVRAATAASGACFVSVLALSLSGLWGPMPYMFTSPCLLYMLYSNASLELGMLTRGLSGRQSLKRNLEASLLNPRDADAHYQLGLIYAQRRSYEEAQSRFKTALSIDSQNAESHYELGRVFAAQNRLQEAVAEFRQAASIDDRLASHEVWRELGAACLRQGDAVAAVAALEKYTERRPYDPEGLVYYGNALKLAGNPAEARLQYERAVEAVKTMPSNRRAKLVRWQREAQDGLARC